MVIRPSTLFLLLVSFLLSPCFQSAAAQESGAVQLLGHYWGSERGDYVAGSWGWTDDDGREYALLGNYCGTAIVDITDPNNMVERGFIEGPCNSWREVQTYSHYAYVVSEGGWGTQIIDLAPLPAAPVLVKNFTYSSGGKSTYYAHTVHIREGYMLLNGCAAWSPGGIVIFDLADPVNPAYVSSYNKNYIHDSYLFNDTIYGAGIYNVGADIVSLDNPSSPKYIATIKYSSAGTHNTAVTEDGRYLLTTDEINNTPKTLKIWDLWAAGRPKVAEYVGHAPSVIHNVFVKGTYAYISYYTAGVKVVDLADPVHPVEVGGYDTYSGTDGGYDGAWSTYPYFSSGKITIGDRQTGLYVVKVNLEGPKAPTAFSAYSDYATPNSIRLRWDDPTELNSGNPLPPGAKIKVYRNADYIGQVNAGVEEYTDNGLSRHVEYDYTLRAVVLGDSSATVSASAYAGGHAVPQAITDFRLFDASEGIRLEWTNPSRQLDGTPFNDFDAVVIYRDDILWKIIEQSAADTGYAWSLTDTVAGYHSYQMQVRDDETPAYSSTMTPTYVAFGGLSNSYSEDFETGPGLVFIEGAWDTTSLPGSGGSTSFADSPAGTYGSNENVYFITPPVIIGDYMSLRFKHVAIIAGPDFGYVEISRDHNRTYSTLRVYNWSRYPQWIDGVVDSTDWVAETFSLAAYAGDTVSIRFRLRSYPPTEEDGWYVDDIVIGYGADVVTINHDALEGWNMLSLPLQTMTKGVGFLYPDAASAAFSYNGTYTRIIEVEHGRGYWMKFGAPATHALLGKSLDADTVAVKEGWNLIGSLSDAFDTNTVLSDPGGIVQSHFYAYDGAGYAPAAAIVPGSAYWVKVSQNGSLLMQSSGGTAVKAHSIDAAGSAGEYSALEVTGTDGKAQRLYFGVRVPEREGEGQFALPPPPPAGGRDARFATGSALALVEPGGERSIPLLLTAASFPLTIRSLAGAEPSCTASLIIDGKEAPLNGSGSVRLAARPASLLLKLSGVAGVPAHFALAQNYPNPFNPETHLQFTIVNLQLVTLKVYNILGEEVATLVNEIKGPGTYTVRWDAEGLPSGVYHYRLTAGSFTDVKRMILAR